MLNVRASLIVLVLFVPCSFAQKVKVGHDKGTDFSKYKTYSLILPTTPPSRPLLYASVVGSIQQDLEAKGLVAKDKDGDLTVIPIGGLEYGLPSHNPLADTCERCQAPLQDPVQWSGSPPPMGSSGKPQPSGTLEIDMIDKGTNKLVWSGTVSQKLEPSNVDKSLQLVGKAISKLLAEFPPK
jgi:hypothetical protein